MKRRSRLTLASLLAALCLSGCIRAVEDAAGAVIVEWSLVHGMVLSAVALVAAAAGWYFIRLAIKRRSRDHDRRRFSESSRMLQNLGWPLGLASWGACFILLWNGWQDYGFYTRLAPDGVTVRQAGALNQFAWTDLRKWSHIHSTQFFLAFQNGPSEGRVGYDQDLFGARIQDRAIAITAEAMKANGIISDEEARMQALENTVLTFEIPAKPGSAPRTAPK